jgi:hypothetical protein
MLQEAPMHSTQTAPPPPASTPTRHFTAWPLWASVAGALGMLASVVTDERAGEPSNPDHTVSVADIAPLDHLPFRIGGMLGYLTVISLVVFIALWRRRVEQRFDWSLGASIVSTGLVVTATALTLAYGWKGALGTYLHGALEEGAYDDQGLYVYYVMNDFSPYIGWLGALVAAGGLAWMAFDEGLVSRVLGGLAALLFVGTMLAVGITGVPGLPIIASLAMVGAGLWLAVGRSAITRAEVPA